MELAAEDILHLTTTTATTVLPSFAATKIQATVKPCFCCGGKLHPKTRNSTCNSCQRKGHWSTVCLSKTEKKNYA